MGVITKTHEMETSEPIDPSRMFKALIVDSQDVLPKLMPNVFKSIDILPSDGGVGIIKKINYVDGDQVKYVKHKIEVMDNKNLVCKYELMGQEVMGDEIESVEYEVKHESNGNGGCICKTTKKYHTKGGDSDAGLKAEELHKKASAIAERIFKAIEEYLAANPSVYA